VAFASLAVLSSHWRGTDLIQQHTGAKPLTSKEIVRSRTDYVGISISTACVIHCLFTPLVVALFPVLAHSAPASESVHRILALGVAGVGALASRFGFKRHRRRIMLLPMVTGIGVIVSAACLGDALSHATEVLLTLAGSCCMVTAHWINHTFCSDCEHCTTLPRREHDIASGTPPI